MCACVCVYACVATGEGLHGGGGGEAHHALGGNKIDLLRKFSTDFDKI